MTQGRRVLVTGGASGLGAALVEAFAARGDRVVSTDLAGADLKLDVTSDDDWERARDWVEEQWGGLDVLVNNAGIAAGGRIDVAGFDEWQRGIEINLYGVVRGCRTFVPMMKRQEGGHIVNTASMAGLVHPPAMAPYTAAKAGVVAMSESLHFELSPWRIKVQAVCPSYFRTNLASSFSGADPVPAVMIGRLVDKSPLGAEDIAAEVIAGMETDDPLILTDEVGRVAYRDKHADPDTYRKQQHGYGAKIRALTDSAETPNHTSQETDR
ncbi:SDR family NAD(P)-dependent oxidoreductase [Nocardioides speluncae]|uniref:SDR family NAD(P)-dependent oxidoreductase n=1 Tax=Nocardioides speluncae TaxID=2670337 RepID=UPI000D697081|nr:SDR family NAD(P)-dependent oxidoreductase [Nocardioides speluncae]